MNIMNFDILRSFKQRVANFVDYRIQVKLAEAANTKIKNAAQTAVNTIINDPLTYNQVESVRALAIGVATTYATDIDGDVAEFGTMTGHTATYLARAVAECEASLVNVMTMYKSSPKKLDLFDSFEGLPISETAADVESPLVKMGIWTAGTCEGLNADALLEITSQELDASRITIHPGWFKDTVSVLPEEKRYSLIHIDGDLYISAMDVLDNLFANDHISPGCLVFFDDWNCNKAENCFGERKAWSEIVDKFNVEFSDRGGYGLFGNSFFVHDYKRSRT